MKKTFAERIAYVLPKSVVYWVIVRIFAVASTGLFASKEAGAITLFDCQEAWAKK